MLFPLTAYCPLMSLLSLATPITLWFNTAISTPPRLQLGTCFIPSMFRLLCDSINLATIAYMQWLSGEGWEKGTGRWGRRADESLPLAFLVILPKFGVVTTAGTQYSSVDFCMDLCFALDTGSSHRAWTRHAWAPEPRLAQNSPDRNSAFVFIVIVVLLMSDATRHLLNL